MNLILTRYPTPVGTLGILEAGRWTFKTVERPWIPDDKFAGRPFESCVPVGEYDLEPFHSQRHGSVYALVNHDIGVYKHNTNFRYACLLSHPGNYPTNFSGCIGVGSDWMPDHAGFGVINSKASVSRLLSLLADGHKHTLEIVNSEE